MLGGLLRAVTIFSNMEGVYFVKNIPRTLPEFANRLYEFATNGNEESLARDMTSEPLTDNDR